MNELNQFLLFSARFWWVTLPILGWFIVFTAIRLRRLRELEGKEHKQLERSEEESVLARRTLDFAYVPTEESEAFHKMPARAPAEVVGSTPPSRPSRPPPPPEAVPVVAEAAPPDGVAVDPTPPPVPPIPLPGSGRAENGPQGEPEPSSGPGSGAGGSVGLADQLRRYQEIRSELVGGSRAVLEKYDHLFDREAIQEAEASLAEDPDNLKLLDWLAFMYYAQDRIDRAIETYKKLISRKPDSPDLFFSLGNCFYKANLLPESEYCWRRAKALKPSEKVQKSIEAQEERARELMGQWERWGIRQPVTDRFIQFLLHEEAAAAGGSSAPPPDPGSGPPPVPEAAVEAASGQHPEGLPGPSGAASEEPEGEAPEETRTSPPGEEIWEGSDDGTPSLDDVLEAADPGGADEEAEAVQARAQALALLDSPREAASVAASVAVAEAEEEPPQEPADLATASDPVNPEPTEASPASLGTHSDAALEAEGSPPSSEIQGADAEPGGGPAATPVVRFDEADALQSAFDDLFARAGDEPVAPPASREPPAEASGAAEGPGLELPPPQLPSPSGETVAEVLVRALVALETARRTGVPPECLELLESPTGNAAVQVALALAASRPSMLPTLLDAEDPRLVGVAVLQSLVGSAPIEVPSLLALLDRPGIPEVPVLAALGFPLPGPSLAEVLDHLGRHRYSSGLARDLWHLALASLPASDWPAGAEMAVSAGGEAGALALALVAGLGDLMAGFPGISLEDLRQAQRHARQIYGSFRPASPALLREAASAPPSVVYQALLTEAREFLDLELGLDLEAGLALTPPVGPSVAILSVLAGASSPLEPRTGVPLGLSALTAVLHHQEYREASRLAETGEGFRELFLVDRCDLVPLLSRSPAAARSLDALGAELPAVSRSGEAWLLASTALAADSPDLARKVLESRDPGRVALAVAVSLLSRRPGGPIPLRTEDWYLDWWLFQHPEPEAARELAGIGTEAAWAALDRVGRSEVLDGLAGDELPPEVAPGLRARVLLARRGEAPAAAGTRPPPEPVPDRAPVPGPAVAGASRPMASPETEPPSPSSPPQPRVGGGLGYQGAPRGGRGYRWTGARR